MLIFFYRCWISPEFYSQPYHILQLEICVNWKYRSDWSIHIKPALTLARGALRRITKRISCWGKKSLTHLLKLLSLLKVSSTYLQLFFSRFQREKVVSTLSTINLNDNVRWQIAAGQLLVNGVWISMGFSWMIWIVVEYCYYGNPSFMTDVISCLIFHLSLSLSLIQRIIEGTVSNWWWFDAATQGRLASWHAFISRLDPVIDVVAAYRTHTTGWRSCQIPSIEYKVEYKASRRRESTSIRRVPRWRRCKKTRSPISLSIKVGASDNPSLEWAPSRSISALCNV